MNEPYATTWDNDPLRGWPAACERAAAVIQAVNPNVLLLCEGGFNNARGPNGREYTSWGEDLTGVRARRIVTPVHNRVVYAPHDYPNATQKRFKAGFPGTLAPWWDAMWGYIAKDGIAPVLVGEFSGDFRDPATLSDAVQRGKPYSAKASATRDDAWMKALSDYICANGLSWAYFSFANDPDHAPTEIDVLLAPLEPDGVTPMKRTIAALAAMLAE
jgi:endoglucanase